MGTSLEVVVPLRSSHSPYECCDGQSDGSTACQKREEFGWVLATRGGPDFGAAGSHLLALDATTANEIWRAAPERDTFAPLIWLMMEGQQLIAVLTGHAM